MAKVQIKSEKLTPFGGIFSIMEQFDSMLSHIIDHQVALWGKGYGVPNQTIRAFQLSRLTCPSTLLPRRLLLEITCGFEVTYKVNEFYYEFVRTYSQIYCLIFLLILKSHPHILEVDNKFPMCH